MKKKQLIELAALLVLICIPSIKGTRSYFSDSRIAAGNTFSVTTPTTSPTSDPTDPPLSISNPTSTPTPTPTATSIPSPTPTATPQNIANHVVINEVQTGGIHAGDDFVELYNPANTPVDVSGWKIRVKNSAGAEGSLVLIPSGETIKAHGFLLWASEDNGFNTSINADVHNTNNLADNYSIALKDKNDIIIDQVAWGSSSSQYVEGTPSANIPNGESIERTPDGYDTDNNSNDFALRAIPDPKNSSI